MYARIVRALVVLVSCAGGGIGRIAVSSGYTGGGIASPAPDTSLPR